MVEIHKGVNLIAYSPEEATDDPNIPHAMDVRIHPRDALAKDLSSLALSGNSSTDDPTMGTAGLYEPAMVDDIYMASETNASPLPWGARRMFAADLISDDSGNYGIVSDTITPVNDDFAAANEPSLDERIAGIDESAWIVEHERNHGIECPEGHRDALTPVAAFARAMDAEKADKDHTFAQDAATILHKDPSDIVAGRPALEDRFPELQGSTVSMAHALGTPVPDGYVDKTVATGLKKDDGTSFDAVDFAADGLAFDLSDFDDPAIYETDKDGSKSREEINDIISHSYGGTNNTASPSQQQDVTRPQKDTDDGYSL